VADGREKHNQMKKIGGRGRELWDQMLVEAPRLFVFRTHQQPTATDRHTEALPLVACDHPRRVNRVTGYG
jgi:hypothetical protein